MTNTPPQQRGGQADILRAVEILRAEAECLRECHAPRGDWTGEPEAQADHDEWMALADRLESFASAPPAPSVGGWMPIESAPRDALWHDGDNHYGEYILVWYPGALRPLRARWWAYGDGKSCNFIADGGLAVFPTVWQHLPQPPKGKP